MLILGIDPGKSGAIAMLESNTNSLTVKEVFDMPITKVGKGSAIDRQGLADILHYCRKDADNLHAIIEKIDSMPGSFGGRRMGTAGRVNFGVGYGLIIGILTAYRVALSEIRPVDWKRSFKLPAQKEAALQLARSLHPEAADRLKRLKDDGRAEAILLANYYANRGSNG